MDSTALPAVAGLLLSLIFSYIPGVSTWYDALSKQRKSLVMLALLLVACLVIFSASCLGYSAQVACTTEGAKSLIPMFVAAMIANQSTYLITKNL